MNFSRVQILQFIVGPVGIASGACCKLDPNFGLVFPFFPSPLPVDIVPSHRTQQFRVSISEISS
jgi:hypothetical protein